MNIVENKVVDPNKERDQKLFDEAYTVPKEDIKIAADRTYQRGMSTMPEIYSIEKRKNDTKVTFCSLSISIGNGCIIARDLK